MEGQIEIRAFAPRDEEAMVAVAVAAWAPVYAHRRECMGDALFAIVHPDWREEKARQIRAACHGEGRPMIGVAS